VFIGSWNFEGIMGAHIKKVDHIQKEEVGD